ncbi:MAG: 4-hydroxybenzoate 3-monooxygenase [Acidimicrobiia bacterium]
MRTQVVIVGGGPAGTLLSQLLDLEGIETVILELRPRDYVLARIRAGVLEQGSVEVLHGAGAGARVDRDGQVHDGVNLAFAGRVFRVDFRRLIGRSVTIYGQTEVQKDLYDARDRRNGQMIFEAENTQLHDLDTDSPFVIYEKEGRSERIDCDFVAGCDGGHGTTRESIPADLVRTYERIYPFGWLGVLSETPPVNEELIYNNHPRGFALCSLRNPHLSRYYLQCPLDTVLDEWPDDRFWEELTIRLPAEVTERLVTGPSIEKSITPLRSYVAEPMSYGRLYLAGDAAHIVPPTGAKGLNLAITDVVYLARALIGYNRTKSTELLDAYSDTALGRVWKAVRFSWWMTTLMHRFEENGSFGLRVQEAELEYLSTSVAAQTAMAENYTGLPLDQPY